MRACRAVRREFSRIVDGESTPDERARIDDHLQRCAPCRRAWVQFEGAVGLLRKAPAPVFDELRAARLRRRLRAAFVVGPAPGSSWPARAVGFSAAALALVLAGYAAGVWVGPGGRLAGYNQALPNPHPEIHLRDGRTGGWIEPAALAEAIRHSRRTVAVVPHVRAPLADVQDEVESRRREVVHALADYGVRHSDVQFLAPVAVQGNLLDGPPVEFWVHDMRPVSYSPPR